MLARDSSELEKEPTKITTDLRDKILQSSIIWRMNTNEIVDAIDKEIARLQQVRHLLGGSQGKTASAKPLRRVKKRVMSAEGRARIAAAQRARWAKQKKLV
jgi:hypothetical protein